MKNRLFLKLDLEAGSLSYEHEGHNKSISFEELEEKGKAGIEEVLDFLLVFGT